MFERYPVTIETHNFLRGGDAMAVNPITRKALEVGRRQADEVLQFRTRELRRRTRAVKRHVRAVRTEGGPPLAPELLRAVGGPVSAGVLVAEGDSWFDYPFNDILRILEDHHGYEVK